jgi:hypothetical protein
MRDTESGDQEKTSDACMQSGGVHLSSDGGHVVANRCTLSCAMAKPWPESRSKMSRAPSSRRMPARCPSTRTAKQMRATRGGAQDLQSLTRRPSCVPRAPATRPIHRSDLPAARTTNADGQRHPFWTLFGQGPDLQFQRAPRLRLHAMRPSKSPPEGVQAHREHSGSRRCSHLASSPTSCTTYTLGPPRRQVQPQGPHHDNQT